MGWKLGARAIATAFAILKASVSAKDKTELLKRNEKLEADNAALRSTSAATQPSRNCFTSPMCMEEDEPVSVWPQLVAGAMFDLKGTITIVSGFGRMLELERCGPITEKQRAAVHGIQHAARQIKEVVDALEGLASLHGAGWRVEMTTISLRQVLSEVGRLPIGERQGSIDVRIQAEHNEVMGALPLVRRALVGLVRIVAFDQLNGERPLSIWIVDSPTASELWIVLAATDQIREAVRAPRESLSPLRWTPRGLSMDLPFASGIVQAHRGQLLALPEGISGMVVALPKLSAT